MSESDSIRIHNGLSIHQSIRHQIFFFQVFVTLHTPLQQKYNEALPFFHEIETRQQFIANTSNDINCQGYPKSHRFRCTFHIGAPMYSHMMHYFSTQYQQPCWTFILYCTRSEANNYTRDEKIHFSPLSYNILLLIKLINCPIVVGTSEHMVYVVQRRMT